MQINWLVLPCKVPPNTAEPITPAEIRKLFTGPGSLADYWSQVTLGAVDFSRSVVIDQWITPSFDRTGYRGGATPELRQKLMEAMLAAARAAHAPVDNYPYIAFYLNEEFDLFGPEGRALFGHGVPQIGMAHEMGHGIGLDHTYAAFSPPTLVLDGPTLGKDPGSAPPNLMPAIEYGNRADVMSAFNVWDKDGRGPAMCGPLLLDLGAIGDGQIVDVQVGAAPGVFVLSSLNKPDTTLPRLIRVRVNRGATGVPGPERPGVYEYFFEFRVNEGWDEALPNAGVLIHEVRPVPQADGTHPDKRLAARVVRLCRARRGVFDPPLGAGERFIDPDRGIAVRVRDIDVTRKEAVVEVEGGYRWSLPERFRALHDWSNQRGYVGGLPTFHQANYGRRFGSILLKGAAAEWRDIPADALNNPTTPEARFRAVNDWAVSNGYVSGFPNFHEATSSQGKVYGAVLLKPDAADWRDIPAAALKNPTTPDARFRAVNDWAAANGYVSGFPNFHEADRSSLQALLLSAAMADWRDIPAAALNNPTTPDARFRAVNDWAVAHGYVSGFPNFHEAEYGIEFGTVLLKPGAADWRDIPANELNNATTPDARFRAVNDWAAAHGYVSGFPNFHEATHGQGKVYGAVLLKPGAVDWRDIPAGELNNPTTPDARFRAINDWAAAHGYVSGFPNFHEATYGQGKVYGAVLLKPDAADWRDIPARELNNPTTPDARFRAVNDWAAAHAYVSGFPNFHEANHGLRYGTILLKRGASEWHDIPAAELDSPPGFAERIAAVNQWARSRRQVRLDVYKYDGAFPNFHEADNGSGLVYGTITFQRNSTKVAHVLTREVGSPRTPEEIFRAMNDWAAAQGYVGALPTFGPAEGLVYGSVLVEAASAEWRDLTSAELGEPPGSDARFRAVNDWAAAHGYVSGFPNFHEADYGTEFGTVLFKPGAANWRDIPAAELNNPTTPEARFRAVNDWAAAHDYVSGFPNFHEADYGNGKVYGAILLTPDAADWRDIPAAELNNPTTPEARFRAVNDWAAAHDYVSGFPNFHEADHGQGKVYGVVLLKPAAADWRDIPARELY